MEQNAGASTHSSLDIMSIFRAIFIKLPSYVFNKVFLHQKAICDKLSQHEKTMTLGIMFAVNMLIVIILLLITRNPVGLLKDAFLSSPFGGFLALLAKLGPWMFRSITSVEQLSKDSEVIGNMMNNLGDTIKSNSLWLLSGAQFFGIELIKRMSKSANIKGYIAAVHYIVFSVAFGGIASILLKAFVWSKKGFGTALISPGPHGVLHYICLIFALFAVLTLAVINLHTFFGSFKELLIAVVIPASALFLILGVMSLITGTPVLDLGVRYRLPIIIIGLPIVTISYFFMKSRLPDITDPDPIESIEEIDKAVFNNGKD